jgi:DnaJ-class molecular chaperone
MTTLLGKRKCGYCGGDGWVYQYDGVGGRWKETCWQCRGKGEVVVGS